MRFLKRQTTSNKNALGKAVVYDINDQVILDSRNVMLVPKGTTAERPLSPENGHFRYNITTEEFEAYQDGQWRKVRYKEPRKIVQQTLRGAAGLETIFGPLENQDLDFPVGSTADSQTLTDIAKSMIVLIENVFQISTTNYNLVQNPSTPFAGAEIEAADLVAGTEYLVTATNDGTGGLSTDFTTVGAPDSNQGTVFTATGPAAGTGLVRETGYYLEFTSGVPFDKPVTVLHNFNK